MSSSLTKQKEKNAKSCQDFLWCPSTTLLKLSKLICLFSSTIQVLESVKTQLRYLPHQQTVPEAKKQTISNNIKLKLTWCIEHSRFCNDRPFSQLNPQIIIQMLPCHSGTSSATGFKHLDNGHLALLSFPKGKSTSLTISYRQ